MTKIAFLGLGAMGSRMAANLIRSGHALTVWNRDKAKAEPLRALGALEAETPRLAAEGQDFVISMLRDDEASRHVWLDPAHGALASTRSDGVAIECSTLSVPFVRQLAQALTAKNIRFLDAPVVGSRPQAEAGQLFFLIGGTADTYAQSRPVLAAMGHSLNHVGGQGAGATLKLVVNELFAAQIAVLAETLGFLRASGLDLGKAIEVIGLLPVASPVATASAAAMRAGTFAPLFPVELVEKDMAYAVKSGELLNARLPLAEATRQVMQNAIAQGLGSDNLTGVVRLYMQTSPDQHQ